MVFITVNSLRVSGGSSAHHQELKTVYTASGICRAKLDKYPSMNSMQTAVNLKVGTQCGTLQYDKTTHDVNITNPEF